MPLCDDGRSTAFHPHRGHAHACYYAEGEAPDSGSLVPGVVLVAIGWPVVLLVSALVLAVTAKPRKFTAEKAAIKRQELKETEKRLSEANLELEKLGIVYADAEGKYK